MKRKLLVGMVLVLVILFLSSCGIPQEEYDDILAQRDAAQAEVVSLQSELNNSQSQLENSQSQIEDLESDVAEAQSQISDLESDYQASQSEVDSLQNQLSSAQDDYNALQQRVDNAAPYGEYLDMWLFVPTYDLSEDMITEWDTIVTGWDNANAKDKWETYKESRSGDDYTMFLFAVWDALWAQIR